VHSEWDSSESESMPVVRGSLSGFVGAAAAAAATAKPHLASVTEKTEVCCLYFTLHFCLITGMHV